MAREIDNSSVAHYQLQADLRDTNYLTQRGYKTSADAQAVALACEALTRQYNAGRSFAVLDEGEYCSPRYWVRALPKVGDPVSYAFNGDCYPCGHVTKVLTTKIETNGGERFNRQKNGWFRRDQTWTLVLGHAFHQNPEL